MLASMMLLLRTVLFIFLFSISLPLFGIDKSNQKYLIKKYGSTEGLSHNTVTSLIQDKKGFLWIGTYYGLNRFDGHEFISFSSKEDGIAYASIRALVETGDDIWIGTEKGLSTYRDNKIFTFPSIQEGLNAFDKNDKEDSSEGNDNIRSLSIDKQGYLLVGSIKGVTIFKPEMDSQEKFKIHKRLLRLPAKIMYVDDENDIWVGDKGLTIIKNHSVDTPSYIENKFNGKEIISILEEAPNKILVTVKAEGVFQIDKKLEKIELLKTYKGLSLEPFDDWILNKNKFNQIVFSSVKKGVAFRIKNNKYTIFNEKEGIASPTGSFTDREKNIWLISSGYGLAKLYTQKVKKLTKDELDDTNIRSMFIDNDRKDFWLGAQESILLQKGLTDKFEKVNKFPVSKVRTIVKDEQGTIWFAAEQGLLFYKNSKLSFATINDKKLIGKSIYSLTFANGKLFLAREDGSFYVSDYNGNIKEAYEKKHHGLSIIWQVQMSEDKNKVALQGPDGIWIFDIESKQFKELKIDETEKIRRVEKLIYKNDNDYIVYFDNTLLIKNETDGVKKIVDEFKKFINSAQIVSLLKDSNDNIWMGTSRGVLQYKSKELNEDDKIIYFDKEDGLAGNNCNFHSILEYQNKVYIGSSEGISELSKKNIRLNRIPPIPTLSRIIVNGETINTIETNVFEHNKNDFEFYFSAMSLTRPDRVHYKYTLNGLGLTKEISTNRNFALYNNLPSGDYSFLLMASNNDNKWSEKKELYRFTVKQAFWETIWFKILLFISGGILLFGIYKLRVYQIERQKKILEGLVTQRTKELTVEKKKSDDLLLNILPFEIAQELKENHQSEPRQYKSVTVVFTDFVGFTGISEKLTASELVYELNSYFLMFDSVLDKYNIEKLKTIGDGYMAAGGIPADNKTHPIDCMLAFLEIQRNVIERKNSLDDGPKWSLRIGIHTGSIIAGVIGKKKFSYDVWGDTVNTASRLESSGVPDKVNISQETYEKIKDFFECEYRGKVVAKGKGNLDMYLVLSIKKDLSINGEGISPNEKFYNLYDTYKQTVS